MDKSNPATSTRAMFSRSQSGYIPTLDSWRAIAIFGVICFHSDLVSTAHVRLHTLQKTGASGVELFFAISGILICTRLLDEESNSGSISLKNFYLRRLFRIQPAALLYLITIAALGACSIIPFSKNAWLTALFSVRNFYPLRSGDVGPWYTAHFWTLAVEEHFYLVLPWLLGLLKHRHRLRWFVGISVVSTIIYEAANWRPYNKPAWYSEFELCWLFVPACLALLLRKSFFRERFVRFFPATPTFCAVTLLMIAMVFQVRHIQHLYLPCLSILVMATALNPESLIGKFLEVPLMRIIGRLSYSLYLWQQLFCIAAQSLERANLPLAWLQRFPQSWFCALICAFLSYLFIEKPFIKLGHRLAPPLTAGHKDLAPSTLESSIGQTPELSVLSAQGRDG